MIQKTPKKATVKESRTIRSILGAAILVVLEVFIIHTDSPPEYLKWIKDPYIIDGMLGAIGLILYRLVKLKVDDNEKVLKIIKEITEVKKDENK